MEFAYESVSPFPLLCVCSPGIDEVLQECGDKAKAVEVRHSAVVDRPQRNPQVFSKNAKKHDTSDCKKGLKTKTEIKSVTSVG